MFQAANDVVSVAYIHFLQTKSFWDGLRDLNQELTCKEFLTLNQLATHWAKQDCEASESTIILLYPGMASWNHMQGKS